MIEYLQNPLAIGINQIFTSVCSVIRVSNHWDFIVLVLWRNVDDLQNNIKIIVNPILNTIKIRKKYICHFVNTVTLFDSFSFFFCCQTSYANVIMDKSRPTRVARKIPPRDWSVMPLESSVIGHVCRYLLFQNLAILCNN